MAEGATVQSKISSPLGSRLMRRLEALADFSSETDALTRLYLTPEHRAAADAVAVWMRAAGMAAHMDAVGTVIGRYESARPGAPALLVGSHIDTVRNGGKYDGNLGVLAAIEAVDALHLAGERRPFAIEVLAFGDEEGVRFPVTLTGSRALAGLFRVEALEAKDADGVTLRAALETFGLDPSKIPALARRKADVLGYVEVHIEQGPVLEAANLPVGVVTAISGASRFAATLEGVAGHAGTVPMTRRQDALAAAAEMVLAVESCARETPELVATVGQISAKPGAVNVIASRVEFSLDIRSPQDAVRHAAVLSLTATLQNIAARRSVALALRNTYDEAAAQCDAGLSHALSHSVARQQIAPLPLPSGAGHDGLAMQALCPIAMLFARCKGGVSHSPAEAVTAADADTAVAVLTDFLRGWQPRGGR